MLETSLIVHDDKHEIIGWVRNFGCENPDCITAIVNGKKWHAIPRRQGATLPSYHFNSVEAALQAIHEAELANR